MAAFNCDRTGISIISVLTINAITVVFIVSIGWLINRPINVLDDPHF